MSSSKTGRPSGPRKRLPWTRWVALLLFVVCLVVAFVNLGQWQLRRLDERRGDNATVRVHEAAPIVDYQQVFDHPITDADAWQRVRVTGTFDPAGQLIVRYRTNSGTPGYEVVVPLRADDGRTVLIDRGFLARPVGEDFPTSVDGPPSGVVTVIGYVRRNEQGPPQAVTPASGSVRLINSDAIGEFLGRPLVNGYIDTTEMTPPQSGYQPVQTPPLDEGPHLSYALQWFTFSLIALLGTVVLIRNDIRDRKKAEAKAARAAAARRAAEAEAAADPAPTADADADVS